MRFTYTTRSGDTLGKLAERYQCLMSELESDNDLSRLVLLPGQIVNLPVSDTNAVRLTPYTVNYNESILKIINTTKITYDEFKYFNPLFNLILAENQTLRITSHELKPALENFETYIVT